MSAHDILDIDTAEQELVRLHVVVGIGLAHRLVVVLLGEEPRGAQHDAGDALVAMEQLAKILGRSLGHTVDILRDRLHLLGHPCGGRARGRDQRVAEHAGGAGVDERGDACVDRLFQKIERAGDVGVDEVLPAVSRDVGLVQRRGMEDGPRAAHATLHAGAVGDRADTGGEGPLDDVEADHLAPHLLQRAHEGLAQVPGASRDQNRHRRAIRSAAAIVHRRVMILASNATLFALRGACIPRINLVPYATTGACADSGPALQRSRRSEGFYSRPTRSHSVFADLSRMPSPGRKSGLPDLRMFYDATRAGAGRVRGEGATIRSVLAARSDTAVCCWVTLEVRAQPGNACTRAALPKSDLFVRNEFHGKNLKIPGNFARLQCFASAARRGVSCPGAGAGRRERTLVAGV